MANAKSFYAILPCERCQKKTYHMDGCCCNCGKRTTGLQLIVAQQEAGQTSPRILSIEEFVARRALLAPEVYDGNDTIPEEPLKPHVRDWDVLSERRLDEAVEVRWLNETSLEEEC